MLLWMTYAVLVGGLTALGALAVDRAARLARIPTRWVWAAGVALAIGLAMRTPPIEIEVTGPTTGYALRETEVFPAGPARWIGIESPRFEQLTQWLDVTRLMRAVGASSIRRVGDGYVVAGWISLGAILGIVFAGVHVRLRRARARWPRAILHGVAVRVSPRVGPAAIGLARPEVVVPRWLLARSDAEQRMAITHEAEHVRAGDGQLLAVACVALILFPWNPALWLIVSRLRLAIEVDCDRRVLRRGASPHAYGSLLVAVAELATPLRPSALALADDSSHLRTRILAMDTHRPSFTSARAGLAALVGALALLAACEAKEPTAADVDALNVASAEKAARKIGALAQVDTGVAYTVDGATVTASQARSIDAADIAKMDIRKGPNARDEVRINTKRGVRMVTLRADSDVVVHENAIPAGEGRGGRGSDGMMRRTGTMGTWPTDTAIVWFINGVRSNYAAVSTIDRGMIESIEVIKGPAAAAEYQTPLGKSVIAVRTKAGR